MKATKEKTDTQLRCCLCVFVVPAVSASLRSLCLCVSVSLLSLRLCVSASLRSLLSLLSLLPPPKKKDRSLPRGKLRKGLLYQPKG